MKSRIEYKFARDFRKFVERMENYFNKYDEITRVRDIDLSMFTFEMIKKKKKHRKNRNFFFQEENKYSQVFFLGEGNRQSLEYNFIEEIDKNTTSPWDNRVLQSNFPLFRRVASLDQRRLIVYRVSYN